jgi:hypothetical protein
MTNTQEKVRIAALLALATGTLCTLRRAAYRSSEISEHEARVTHIGEDFTEFEFTDPDVALANSTVTIYHNTGESASGVWAFLDVIHEPEAEEPKAEVLPAIVLPRGASWLMDEAKNLEAEAGKYGEHNSYGSPRYAVQSALKSAANVLRGAVGNALAIEQGITEIGD